MNITISLRRDFDIVKIVDLYRSNKWSSADNSTEPYQALINSPSLLSAWDDDKLFGDSLIGDSHAIPDRYKMGYYPNLHLGNIFNSNVICSIITTVIIFISTCNILFQTDTYELIN